MTDTPEELRDQEPIPPATDPVAEETQPTEHDRLWSWVRFGLVAFLLMLFYIYNQHHANKALRKKDKLLKELKELHSEKISLESEITNASKQSELAKRLQESGLRELREPPVKIEDHGGKKR